MSDDELDRFPVAAIEKATDTPETHGIHFVYPLWTESGELG